MIRELVLAPGVFVIFLQIIAGIQVLGAGVVGLHIALVGLFLAELEYVIEGVIPDIS